TSPFRAGSVDVSLVRRDDTRLPLPAAGLAAVHLADRPHARPAAHISLSVTGAPSTGRVTHAKRAHGVPQRRKGRPRGKPGSDTELAVWRPHRPMFKVQEPI